MPKVQEPYVRDVPVKELVLHPKCQMRVETSWITVQEYADAMLEGAVFPPVDVYYQDGDKKYVADGWHRALAAKQAKLKTLLCLIHHGGLRAAIMHAAGANTQHGLRRSNADKRHAVLLFLADREWKKWNSSEIARRCNVSPKLVEIIREKEGDNQHYRVQFNGRGEIQYRKTSHHPDNAESVGFVLAHEPKKCPNCGFILPE